MNTRIVIGPNASLSGRQALMFFGWMCMVGLAIAGFFASRGYWPILPFAGLELAALGAALAVTQRRNRYREVLRFHGAELRIEFGLTGSGASSVCTLPRAWTQVILEPGATGNSPTRLVLRLHGQTLEIGHCLTDEERERLARRLRELMVPAWRTDVAEPAARRV